MRVLGAGGGGRGAGAGGEGWGVGVGDPGMANVTTRAAVGESGAQGAPHGVTRHSVTRVTYACMVCMQVRLLGAEQIRGREHYTAYKLQRLGDADKHGQREPEGEPLYRRFRQFVQLVASLLEVRAATYVAEAATPYTRPANPMRPGCHPHVHAPSLPPHLPFALPSPGMYPGRRRCKPELRAPGRASGRAARARRRSSLKVPSRWCHSSLPRARSPVEGSPGPWLRFALQRERSFRYRPVLTAACASVAPISLPC